jgi:hypothetical protein
MSALAALKARLEWCADLVKTGVHSAHKEKDAEGNVIAKVVDRPVNSKSVIYKCGVKVENNDSCYFYCLVGDCAGTKGEGTLIKMYKGSTKEPINHLR